MNSQRDAPQTARPLLAWPVGLALGVATLLIYCPVLDFDFINLDDRDYVVHNPHVQAGVTVASVWWALTSTEHANWHPLTWLSLQLDRDLYGGLKPGGFHLTNLVLHLANVLLLFVVLRRMTGALWRSALVAGLFALHPLHVQSVAWVAERKDVLSTLFWMLTLWAYAAYVERPGPVRYALVLLAFALGLTAKPMLVTLPCVLLLLDYYPLRRWVPRGTGQPGARPLVPLGQLVAEKLPLLGLALASCAVTLWAQGRSGSIGSLTIYPLDVRLLNAAQAYVDYLVKTAWPADLAIHYLHPGETLPRGQALGAGAVLLAVTVAVLFAARRPYLTVGWYWYLGTLVPVIGIIQVGDQAMADRYTYVPLIGIFLVVAWGSGDLAEGVRVRGLRGAVAVLAAAALAACALGTWVQLGTWRNSRTVWEHAVRTQPDNYVAHGYLGLVYLEADLPLTARQHFARAVELRPASVRSRVQLGMVCLALGDAEQAETHLSAALELDPNLADVHHNLALTYALGPPEKRAAALEHSRQAVALEGDWAEAHSLLAYLCNELGRAEEAAEHYRTALRLDPRWPEVANARAWQLIAGADLTTWKASVALLYARQACQATDERRGEFLEIRAAAEAAAGRYAQAAQTLRKALALFPQSAEPDRYRALEHRLRLYEQLGP